MGRRTVENFSLPDNRRCTEKRTTCEAAPSIHSDTGDLGVFDVDLAQRRTERCVWVRGQISAERNRVLIPLSRRAAPHPAVMMASPFTDTTNASRASSWIPSLPQFQFALLPAKRAMMSNAFPFKTPRLNCMPNASMGYAPLPLDALSSGTG